MTSQENENRHDAGEEEIRIKEEHQDIVERLTASYLSRKIDLPTYKKELKQVRNRIDLRRAGLKLKMPDKK